ncbi:MAG: cell wall-binding repeat-containing protein [Lachnospiraceae bacterium]|nr:cell wall-binding repeat-containing protein [Lachnospiraceae bacterium]
MRVRIISCLLAALLLAGAVPAREARAEEETVQETVLQERKETAEETTETAAEETTAAADETCGEASSESAAPAEAPAEKREVLAAEEEAAEMIYLGELADGLCAEEPAAGAADRMSFSTDYPNTWVNTGDQARDLVEIALTQVGYKENSDHTKYNNWYYGSDTAAAWCNIFVSWCANQAGIPTSIVPKMAATRYTKAWMVENAYYDDTFTTTPRCGDLLFFHNDEGTICHIAIIISYNASDNTIRYVGGNQSNSVTVRTLEWVKNKDWYGIKLDGYARPYYTVTQQETVRVYGSTRYDTCIKTADLFKETLGLTKFPNIVLTTGTGYADALSGSLLALQKKAPILLTNASNASKINTYIKNNLQSGGTIYVLGGTGAVPASLLSGLSGYKITRLSGSSRYATNLAVLAETSIAYGSEVFVVTGTNYADSLSAASSGKAILLVSDNLSKEQKTCIQGLINQGCTFTILGGEAAVSVDVEQTIRSLGGDVGRLYGSTRYATSALFAETYFPNAARVILAYGENYPDGLCAGPLGAVLHAPVLLAADGKESRAKAYVSGSSVSSGTVLGGPSCLPDASVRKILGLSNSTSIVVK